MTKRQQQKAAFVFGIVFASVMLAIALFVPAPTTFQYVVFRIVLALAAAGIAAMPAAEGLLAFGSAVANLEVLNQRTRLFAFRPEGQMSSCPLRCKF